jgi:hypothetical protein
MDPISGSPVSQGPDRQAVAAWLAVSCARSGVAVKVTDPSVLRQIGVLLGAETGEQPRQAKRVALRRLRSLQPPDWLDTLGIEPISTTDGGRLDDDMVDQRPHNRGLPGQVQALPPVA